jgi:hypothetical protein
VGFPLGFNEDKAPEPGKGSGGNSNASVPDQGTSRGVTIVGDRNLEIEGAPNEQAAIAEHGHWSPIEHGRPCPISERHDDKSAVDPKSDQPFHLKPVIRPFHPEQRAVKIHDKSVCPLFIEQSVTGADFILPGIFVGCSHNRHSGH